MSDEIIEIKLTLPILRPGLQYTGEYRPPVPKEYYLLNGSVYQCYNIGSKIPVIIIMKKSAPGGNE